MPVTIKILLDQYTEILRKIYGSHLKTVILYDPMQGEIIRQILI